MTEKTDFPMKATHDGAIRIAEVEINCHILEDKRRMLSTRGVMKAPGRTWRGRKYTGTQLPVFLEANNLKPFIIKHFEVVPSPVIFETTTGAQAEGFDYSETIHSKWR